ncbi:cupin domain-containing protein [Acrocarpospora catenulata]|uniref:cupin domain-containing protein n=1 Tax=Acrocarpospora catenulata TaxID=2836182 RepID=UPI001BD931AC|nr:cupin domain-containing protein [Acrocarpospora catenulata]
MTTATLADAPVFERDGSTIRSLAVPSRGSTELAVWSLEFEPGARSPEHSVDREEVFVVQSGRLVAHVGGREHVAGPGDALIVPVRTMFWLGNGSDAEPVRVTVCTSAGIQGTVDGTVISPPWAQ